MTRAVFLAAKRNKKTASVAAREPGDRKYGNWVNLLLVVTFKAAFQYFSTPMTECFFYQAMFNITRKWRSGSKISFNGSGNNCIKYYLRGRTHSSNGPPLFYSAEKRHSQVHCVAGNRQKMCVSYMTTTATQCEYKKAAFKKITQFLHTRNEREKNLRCFFFHRRTRRINQGHLYLVIFLCICIRPRFIYFKEHITKLLMLFDADVTWLQPGNR